MTTKVETPCRGRSGAVPERSPGAVGGLGELKEGARGGTMGSALNEWGYSCRLVDLMGKLF